MQYGFVLDQRRCIGCHACTVACKSENEVPLGKFRTWVKYVEKGTFPAVRRHFTVLRCNHCDAAPCVEICPVVALHKRKDAIVDLDRDRCIGCRACMQACPYDALYIDEERGVAEKCHYCAHRTELGLEPACVVVCPERAIVAGDVSDPESPIAKLIREQSPTQRRLEKGTKPRVWYVDALPEALVPGTHTEPPTYIWSDRPAPQPAVPAGFEPPKDLVASLDVAHPPQWGWHIWTYLLTKNVSAGVALTAPLLAAMGVVPETAKSVVPEAVSLVFLAATLFLLVHDLGRPERFWRLLLTPNTRSWLVKGGWVLTTFGLVTAASLAARLAGAGAAADALRFVNLPLAVMASGYSAFLFAQCRARDLWLSTRFLFVSLVVEALLCGAAFALVLPAAQGKYGAPALFVTAGLAAVLVCLLEHRYLVDTDHALRAHAVQAQEGGGHGMTVWLCIALMCALLGLGPDLLGAEWLASAFRGAAVGLVLAVLFVRGRAWVRAGQAVPIS